MNALSLAVGARRPLLALSTIRDYGIVVSFVALFITLSISSDPFLSKQNLLNVLEQSAAVGIIACGATFVIIAGGFDLSVGAIYATSGVIAAEIAQNGHPVLGIIAGIMSGAVLGAGNGVLTTLGRINPFIATLASTIIIRGLALSITGGLLITVTDGRFAVLGNGSIGDVKYAVLLLAGVVTLSWFVLVATPFGQHVYAVGGNAVAARLSGIRVNVVKGLTFVISGLCAGTAGVLVASRVSTGQADTGAGLELAAIAAVVIGGTSILGGDGAIWRTVLGVLLFAMIGNGFTLLDVPFEYQQVFQGLIIVTAVAVDAWSRRRETLG